MVNLLKSDFYKLGKSKAYLICIIIAIILAIVGPIMYSFTRDMIQQMPEEIWNDPSVQMSMQADTNLHVGVGSSEALLKDVEPTGQWYIGQLFPGNIIEILMAVFISILITSEFVNGTIKNVVTKGFKRTHIFLSKIITAGVATSILFLIYVLVGTISATVNFGFGPINTMIIGQILQLIALQWILHMALSAIFVTISFLVRSVGGSITFNILVIMFVGTITSASNLILGNRLGDHLDLNQYWLQSIINNTTQLEIASGDMIRILIVSGIYLVVAFLFGRHFFQKQDIR